MPLDVPPPLAPLVVEAPRLPPLAGEQVFSIETLEAADLRGAQRLDEALKRTPGVSLFRRAGSDAAASVGDPPVAVDVDRILPAIRCPGSPLCNPRI